MHANTVLIVILVAFSAGGASIVPAKDASPCPFAQRTNDIHWQKIVKSVLLHGAAELKWHYPTSTHDLSQWRNFGVLETQHETEGGGHEGCDIDGESGDPIRATADGTVVYVLSGCKEGSTDSERWCGNGWGNHVVLLHPHGIHTRYGHMNRVHVEVGQRINAGEQIGTIGSTGLSDGPHLHFELGWKKDPFRKCDPPQNFDAVYDPKLLPYQRPPHEVP